MSRIVFFVSAPERATLAMELAELDQAFDVAVAEMDQASTTLSGQDQDRRFDLAILDAPDPGTLSGCLELIREPDCPPVLLLVNQADEDTAERLAHGRAVILVRDHLSVRSLRRTARLVLDRAPAPRPLADEPPGFSTSRLLTSLSHEIRTPLSGIVGMTELALAEPLAPGPRHYVSLAHRSARALLDVLHDLLELAEQEHDPRVLLTPLSVRDVMASLESTFASANEVLGLRLRIDVAQPILDIRSCDSTVLRQSLYRFVSAMTGRGFTDILLKAEASCPQAAGIIPDGDCELHFALRGEPDQGDVLIQEEDLASCRRQAARLGGRTWIERDPEGGFFCHLIVRLSQASGSAACPGSMSPRPLPKLKLLLAEDNEVNQLFASELLTRAGHQVTAAGSGTETLRALAREDYDLLLLDIQMPDMDGVEVTQNIRQGITAARNPCIPIIALTAHALAGDRAHFLAAGMDAFIAKPLSLEEFTIAASGLLNRQSSPCPAKPSAIDESWLRSMTEKRPAFLKSLFEAYVQNEPRRLGDTIEALRTGDMEKVCYLAHSMKGAAATLGAMGVKEAAAMLEREARKPDRDAAMSHLDWLEQELGRTVEFMAAWIAGTEEALE